MDRKTPFCAYWGYLVCRKGVFDMNEKEQKEIKAEEERIRENGQATLEGERKADPSFVDHRGDRGT